MNLARFARSRSINETFWLVFKQCKSSMIFFAEMSSILLSFNFSSGELEQRNFKVEQNLTLLFFCPLSCKIQSGIFLLMNSVLVRLLQSGSRISKKIAINLVHYDTGPRDLQLTYSIMKCQRRFLHKVFFTQHSFQKFLVLEENDKILHPDKGHSFFRQRSFYYH